MLFFKSYLKPSKIAGIGLFTSEKINKGDIIWKYDSYFTSTITKEEYNNLDIKQKERIEYLDFYWVDSKGNYKIPLDHDRFMNHSNNPNVIHISDHIDIAARDINVDEELTVDYKTLVPKSMWKDYFY